MATDVADRRRPKSGSGNGFGSLGGTPVVGGTTTSTTSTGLTSSAFEDSEAGWAYGFLKFLGAAGNIKDRKQAEADPRVQWLVAWMGVEGTYTIGNPYNPLNIEYHGSVTQEKKRWNPQGVSMFSSRTKGYEALQDYINGYGAGPFPILSALKQQDVNLAGLESATTATDWPGNPSAAPGYTATIASRLSGIAQQEIQQESGNFAGTGGVGATSSLSAPKHNTQLYKDQWGNEAIRSPTPTEQYSAYERTQQTLRMWGLNDPKLVAMVHARVVAGEDYNQIINDIRKTPQYAAQFPGMEFRAKAGLPLISESQYISYERSMMGLATKYSLPRDFISKHEVGELIAHNVSPVEFNQRLQGLATLVTQANPLVKQEFEKYFGVRGGNGALAAYWANPGKATLLLQQQLHAAEYGAQVRETGLGNISRGQAVALSHYEYLHTPGTVTSAIADAAHYSNLEGAAPGSSTSSVSVQQLLGARLAGVNGNQAENDARVRNAESAKEATILAGGGYSASSTGVTGAGGASTEGVGRA